MDSSLRPRFSTVSIMPGMEKGAPERTDTSSGSSASPSLLAHALLQVGAVLGDGVERAFRPHVAGVGVLHAGLARDGESGRHRQPDVGHLGEVRALAAEHPFHLGVALGHIVPVGVLAEGVDALHCFCHLTSP